MNQSHITDKTDPTDDTKQDEGKQRRSALADAERRELAARLRERFSFGGWRNDPNQDGGATDHTAAGLKVAPGLNCLLEADQVAHAL